MGTDDAYNELLRREDWGAITLYLVAVSLQKGLPRELAEDLALQTIARVTDPARSPWDPGRGATITTHLTWVLRSVTSHHFEKERRGADGEGDGAQAGDSGADGDAKGRPLRSDEQRIILEKLRVAAERRPLAVAILDLEARGINDAAGQAAQTGAKVSQVYEARRFLVETGRALVAQWNAQKAKAGRSPRTEAP